MIDDADLHAWFCQEVLPLERALTLFISRNWRAKDEVADIRQEIYAGALTGARRELPINPRAYVYTIARNNLINRAKRAQIVSFDLFADLEKLDRVVDLFDTERQLEARDSLRRAMAGLERLPPRCAQVVKLRKIEGLSTRETAERLGVGIDTVDRQLALGIRAMADFMLGGTGRINRRSPATGHMREGRE